MLRDIETTIEELIDRQGVSFIASVSEDGFPHMKAMLPPRKRVGIRAFYFTTNTSSMRVAQYRKDPKASIYFCGRMEVLEDPASKEIIWREGDTLYYPKGVTDPDYCVLKFVATGGRYYTDFHSQSFEIA